mgnify:CR=1 FL=1
MNLINCTECCRWQKEGFCTLEVTVTSAALSSECRYFEPL